MSITEAFGGIADLLATLAPEKVQHLKASDAMSARVEYLVNLKKDGGISVAENAELERFLGLNMLISLAKARAHKLLLNQ
jgi:hypothetical protein